MRQSRGLVCIFIINLSNLLILLMVPYGEPLSTTAIALIAYY